MTAPNSAAGARSDRDRWNERHDASDRPVHVAPFVASLDDLLPRRGRALDIAGGAGGDALWLARRGLDTTLVDVSDVALARAAEEAARRGVELRTVRRDLTTGPLPPGPWDVVLCRNYLQRDLFGPIADALAPHGVLVVAIATVRNLQRHAHPTRRFLVEPGELATLAVDGGLDVVVDEEDWFDDRHEARLVAVAR